MPNTVNKLLWVLGISLAVHLILLLGPHFSIPVTIAPPAALEARLSALPPPLEKLVTAKPSRLKKQKPRTTKKTPVPIVEAQPALETQPATKIQPDDETSLTKELPPEIEPEPSTPTAPPMPQRAITRYTVFKGVNGMSVGRAEQIWQIDGERYSISSVAEAAGIFSLFASGRFVQESHGEISSVGLRPTDYKVERGKGGADRTETAHFDWNIMALTLTSGSDKQTLKLPEGTQDLLSFMYQLAFSPPQNSAVKLQVTNGRKLDTYTYWVVEEALKTPMGVLNTLHLGKHREEGEKDTEVWLAADYHYLPVKISQVDKDGDGLVLLANEIAITQ